MRQITLTEDQKTIWRKWSDALRSGKYKQGRGRLLSYKPKEYAPASRRYCCLGVLCDLYAQMVVDGPVGEWAEVDGPVAEWAVVDGPVFSVTMPDNEHFWQTGTPPRPVGDWAGTVVHVNSILTDANDYWYLSFPLIAALIDNAVETGELPESKDEAEVILDRLRRSE